MDRLADMIGNYERILANTERLKLEQISMYPTLYSSQESCVSWNEITAQPIATELVKLFIRIMTSDLVSEPALSALPSGDHRFPDH